MTGKELKLKIESSKVTKKKIADDLGVTTQALNSIFRADDVRSGTIEKIASVLGVDMSFFYPCSGTITNTNIQANHATGNIAGGNQTIEESKALLDIIRQQQETINKLLNK